MDGGSPFRAWNLPQIDGLEGFKGILAHTANYPEGLDLKGKRVAVYGIGSSSIQIIAAIQNDVSKLHTWTRTRTYITLEIAVSHIHLNLNSMELINQPRYEDYDIKYHDMNRWAFLGNGWSVRDYDGRDIT